MGLYDRKRKVVSSDDRQETGSQGCVPGSTSSTNVNQAQSIANAFNPFSAAPTAQFAPNLDSNSNLSNNVSSAPSLPVTPAPTPVQESSSTTPAPTLYGSTTRPRTLTAATILIHPTQLGNDLHRYLQSHKYTVESQLCDFECSPKVGVLFISLRYELDNPEYVRVRLAHHRNASYSLKALLVLLDVDQPQEQISKLTSLALLHDHTVICASTLQECANYLDKLTSIEWDAKNNQNTQKNIMKQAVRSDGDIAVNILKTIRKNNTSAINAAQKNFGSFAGIAVADKESLQKVNKIGPTLATKIYDIMHMPFNSSENKDK